MARICDITKKGSIVGGGYSNRTRATQYNPTGKRLRKANIQKKRIFIPETGETKVLRVSPHGLKIIQKKGPYKALKDAGVL